ncbi:MAG: glyoxalase [Lachnospiraceae bacterium]|nr:glyoxalase [Lachnospiraceae bacterium]
MFDKKVLKCFLDNQLQLFPEEVASTDEEAAEFLEEMFAVVVKGKKEVLEYFEEEGTDIDADTILEACEVFDVGDGRYLIVEA